MRKTEERDLGGLGFAGRAKLMPLDKERQNKVRLKKMQRWAGSHMGDRPM